MFVFLNGQIVKEEDARISIDDLSYQFGYGLFETIRCEKGIPLFIEEHYKRMSHGAKELKMTFPIDIEDLKGWLKQVLSANKLLNARVKVLVSKKAEEKFNVLILVSGIEKPPSSYSLCTKTLVRDTKSASFVNKTTSRADSFISYKGANENGFNDMLYLNEKGELLECTRANIFLVLEDKLITPNLEAGILSGVTRGKVIEIAKNDGIIVEERNVHRLYLNKVLSVFVTSAMMGIMLVSKIVFEDKEYNFTSDKVIIRLKNSYDAEIQNYLKSQENIAIAH